MFLITFPAQNMKEHEEDDAKRNPARVVCDSREIKEQPLEEHAQAEHAPQEQPLREQPLKEWCGQPVN